MMMSEAGHLTKEVWRIFLVGFASLVVVLFGMCRIAMRMSSHLQGYTILVGLLLGFMVVWAMFYRLYQLDLAEKRSRCQNDGSHIAGPRRAVRLIQALERTRQKWRANHKTNHARRVGCGRKPPFQLSLGSGSS